ncbi:AIR synthase family protein [soil metagenome]
MSAFKDNSGKITSSFIQNVLQPQCGHHRKEVKTGPAYGVDTSIIDLGNNTGLAVSSDPLSLIPSLGLKESAWLSVHLLVNDMATTGFAPMYVQFVVNLPPKFTQKEFEEYWGYIHQFCRECGVAITGGHTGQIAGQNSTMPGGGTMFLTAPAGELITSQGADAGDSIIVTKETALTASSILGMSFPKTVKNKLGTEIYDAACKNFYRTSSLVDAVSAGEILQKNVELKAMHDATEGGVLGAIYEMACASGCGFTVDSETLPAGEVQLQITDLFDIDHRLCVGAGSMIMAVKPGCENRLINHLKSKSIRATVVGQVTEKEEGFRLIEDGVERAFIFNEKDPYWEAFFKALHAGWK